MSLDKKILSEIQRYRSINNYITEQAGDDLAALAPEAGAASPPPPSGNLYCGFSPILLSYYPSPYGITHGIARISSSICLNSSSSNSISSLSSS